MKLHTEALALERELARRIAHRHGPGSFEQRVILDIYPQARPR